MSAAPKASPAPSPRGQAGFDPPIPPVRYTTRRSVDRPAPGTTIGGFHTPIAQRINNTNYYDSPGSGTRGTDPSNPFLSSSQRAASEWPMSAGEGPAQDNNGDLTDGIHQEESAVERPSTSFENGRRTAEPHVLRGTYPPSSMARQMHRLPSAITTGGYMPPPRNSFQTTPTRQPGFTRGMSFYDMKQQKMTGEFNGGPLSKQASWNSMNGQYYGDGIAHNGYATYDPPHMGRMDMKRPGSITAGLPWVMWMNSTVKNHFVATVGEFVGTTMFLFFAFAGTQVANIDTTTTGNTTTNATTGFNPAKLLYISLCFGFSLMVNVWIFFRISGGLFNPAVTLALLVTGAIGAWRAVCLFIAQIVGSIAASALVLGLFPATLNVQTTLSSETSIARGIFIEAFLTAELVFTILMLAKEKHRSTFIAPVGIGLALFIAEMCGVYYTGGSLNPARSIGPAIVGNKWDGEHWIYWVGPLIGVLIAVAFYKFIKLLEYEMANPGQDADDANDPTKNPHHEVRERQRDVTARVLKSLGLEEAALAQPQPQPQWLEPQQMQHNNYEPEPRTSGPSYLRPATATGTPGQDAKDYATASNGNGYGKSFESDAQGTETIPAKAMQ